MIDIVKLLNGNVAIYDNSSGDFIFSMSPAIIEMQCATNGIVRVVQNNENFEFFDPAQVANTQVLPAAAIPFTGTCADLADILATDFFFELTDTIDAIDVNYDNTSSGLTSTNVQDAIDELAGTSSAPNLTTVLTAGNSAGNLDILDLDKLDFNTATVDTASEGQLVWNTSAGTLDLGLKGGNTILNVGQQIITRVVNKTVPLVPLTKAGYQVVLVAGATGQRLSVKLAKADNDPNSAGTLGIVCENIAVNQEGFIVSVGPLTEINTTGSLQGETWADGDLLYLSPTTFGAITNVKPSAPFHEVRVGYVEYAHAIHGKIYVKIDNGYEIDELHNVDINTGTLTNNDGLFYNTATSTWQNKPINTALGFTPVTNARTISTSSPLTGGGDLTANRTISIPVATSLANGYLSSTDWTTFNNKQNALGYTPVTNARTLTINGTTYDLTADRTWSVGTVTSVAALTLGTSGTDLSSTVANGTSTPVITLNVPTASATNRGVLSSSDWSAFNGKQNALVSGTNIKTVQSTSLLGSGNVLITDANLSMSDITTNNVSTTQHGFVPKAPNSTSQFLRGDGTWAAPVIADPAGWTYIVKSANQDVTNNAIFQDDTELQFSVVAGGHYMVEMSVCWSGNNATSDYDCRILVTAGVLNGYGIAIASDQTTLRIIAGTSASTSIGTLNLVSTNIDFLNTLTLSFNFNPSANATFIYQFKNALAGAGRISRTWKGSILKYKRID